MKVTIATSDLNGEEYLTATVGNNNWEGFASDAVEFFFGAMVGVQFAPESVYTAMIDFLSERGQLNMPENETD